MAYKNKADKIKYQNNYISAKYDRINLLVAKGKKEVLQEIAKASGSSLNEFINNAIDVYIESQGIELPAPTQDTDVSESED